MLDCAGRGRRRKPTFHLAAGWAPARLARVEPLLHSGGLQAL